MSARSGHKAKKLHRVIREAREARGMTLAELARRAKLSPSYLSRIERGKEVTRAPSEKLLVRLALATGVDRDLLIAAAGKIPSDVHQWLVSREGALADVRRMMAEAA